jgi:1-acyl-sn-glycerol-3-phosphate acyltransferase
VIASLLILLNRLFCRLMFGLRTPGTAPLPTTGPALLVSDHSSLADPLVLFATANRPIRFLMAREFYDLPSLRWLFDLAGCIPVNRRRGEVAPIRAMLRALSHGEVIGVFPQGGIITHRKEEGYEGIGYAALKSGAPVVPVSIMWDRPRPLGLLRALLTPAQATVLYGAPLAIQVEAEQTRDEIRATTDSILTAIRNLKPESTQ